MFYFKDSEYPNSETKTGTTGSFIKYVEKHSCYKAAEKLLLALAERNKECAVYIRPPKLKKKSSVDFYFEEIELSEEEINAFKLLGKYKNALLEKTPVIIQLHFRYKSNDCKEDALDFIIRKYRYIGYNAESYSDTGWIKQERQSEFILTYKSPEKIFFCGNSVKKSFPASITSLYSPDTKIDTEVMSIVLESLNYLYKLFTEEFCREELVIKIKELKNNSYMYRILPAYIVDEIAAIQNLSLPYKKVEDSNDSQ